MQRTLAVVLLGIALIVPVTVNSVAQVVPDDAEPAVASKPTPRGGLAVPSVTFGDEVAAKTVDGDIDDWIGTSTNLSGTSVVRHGEHIWQGFLFDDFGADDGADAQRIDALGPAYKREQRAERIEAGSQAADDQFGAPQLAGGTVVTPPNYGDAAYPNGTRGHADLAQLRVAADAESVYLLARFATMTNTSAPALLLLADTEPGGANVAAPFAGFKSGIDSHRAEWSLFLSEEHVARQDVGTFTDEPPSVDGVQVEVNADGATNALEARIPRDMIAWTGDGGPQLRIAVGAGLHGGTFPAEDAPVFADVATGEADAELLDVAFRQEPVVTNWFDRAQAMALLDGTIDPFFETIELDDLEAGRTDTWRPTPGYHAAVFRSRADISNETTEQGPKETQLQPYGLYLPSDWQPGDERPLTTWLHYRGGTTHQAAAWIPRIVEQLGEERDPANVMVFPRGRGTSTWYAGAAHVDVLEVLDDVERRVETDEDRRYLAGYSMGGYGSYLFGLLYPDRFAAAYPISGAMTIGLWAGVDEQGRDTNGTNGGDGNLENTFRLVENARNLPYVIHHGTNDELVPVTGVPRMAAQFAELGYQYRFYRFLGYEHFTQAVVDEWKEGARYLDQHQREEDPNRVVYKRVPALEHAIETLNDRGAEIDIQPDGAYWLDGLEVRNVNLTDPTGSGQADVDTHPCPPGDHPVPEAGVAAPGHSTPFVMDGLRWIDRPLTFCTTGISNTFDANLTNTAAATLDLDRMWPTAAGQAFGEVHTDGLVDLRLDDGWNEPPEVTIDGTEIDPASSDQATFADGSLVLHLEEGTHTVTVSRA